MARSIPPKQQSLQDRSDGKADASAEAI